MHFAHSTFLEGVSWGTSAQVPLVPSSLCPPMGYSSPLWGIARVPSRATGTVGPLWGVARVPLGAPGQLTFWPPMADTLRW